MSGYFEKMYLEFMKDINWQWWVAQGFALVSIIFCITTMQQKTQKGILWHRCIYSLLIFAGGVFLGELSAIIMMGIAALRNIILLIMSYKKKLSKIIKWLILGVLATSLVALNIIFWENYLSLLSMAVGLAFLIAFIQSDPQKVRWISIVAAALSIVFYALIFAPVNMIINISVLISSIVGLVRFGKKKAHEFTKERLITLSISNA